MAGLMKKRGREEAEELVGLEPKRFHGGAEQIMNLLEEIDSEERGEKEYGLAPNEELLSGVMRSLEEEIGVSSCCTTSYEGSDSSGLSRDGSVVSDMTSGCGAEVDIGYLLGASDDELGILPSPVLDFEGAPTCLEGAPNCLEGAPICLEEHPELKGLSSGNWHFEDDLADYRQFAVIEDGGLDVASLGAFMDGDYSAVWRLETAGGMY